MIRRGAGRVALLLGALWAVHLAGPVPDEPPGGGSVPLPVGARPLPPVSVVRSAAEAERLGVAFVEVGPGTVRVDLRFGARVSLDAARAHVVVSRVHGWVERAAVGSWQRVAVGQPLLTFHAPALVTAQEGLVRARRLRDGIAAPAEGHARDDAAIDAGRRRLAESGVAAEDVEAIERGGAPERALILRTPAAGYVAERRALAGQRVSPGDVLFTIVGLDTLYVEGDVSADDAAGVGVGQSAVAEFPALPGERRRGRVEAVTPVLDPVRRTARVRVLVPNGDETVRPGMSAVVRIAAVPRAVALVVPWSAVLSERGRHAVVVRGPDGGLVPREVTLGARGRDTVEVVGGLAAGERVAIPAGALRAPRRGRD